MKQMRLAVACALAVMTIAPVEAQVQEIVLHNFEKGTGWYNSLASVNLASDGIYGTTQFGGTTDHGVVYKWDTAFHYTVLHNFTAGPGGGDNEPGVIRDSAGNLYGTAPLGGTADYGVVFELDSAGNYTVLYNFTGGADGAYPAGVIRDSAGNLYGTATIGGTAGDGVVFELDSAGNFTVLYNFTGGTDGGDPPAASSGTRPPVISTGLRPWAEVALRRGVQAGRGRRLYSAAPLRTNICQPQRRDPHAGWSLWDYRGGAHAVGAWCTSWTLTPITPCFTTSRAGLTAIIPKQA